MRWHKLWSKLSPRPWRRHGRDVADRAAEARRAREHAEQQLERVRAETPMYAALGQRLRELRERNHFAESIAATFREGRA